MLLGCSIKMTTTTSVLIESKPSNALIQCGGITLGMTPLKINARGRERLGICKALWFGGTESQAKDIIFVNSKALKYEYILEDLFLRENRNDAQYIENDIYRKMKVLEKERREEDAEDTCGCGGD